MSVYVISPYNRTGGPRSLHQLANMLCSKGFDVFIAYSKHGKLYHTNKILYSDCKAKLANSIIDTKNNFVIMPEAETRWCFKLKNTKLIIWWLSLDYYKQTNLWFRAKFNTRFLDQPTIFAIPRFLKYWLDFIIHKENNKYVKKENLKNIFNLYNSEYVHQFLKANNVKDSSMSYLCGPVDINARKQNLDLKDTKMIAYSPAKVQRGYMAKLMKYMKTHYEGYKFVALSNMKHDDLLKDLQKAAIYVDLGFFPGPERIPREAVSYYCNIITSNLGSAANDIDVPIPRKFKVNPSVSNIPHICSLINQSSNNYRSNVSLYDKYRAHVTSQINNFDKDINNLCVYMSE